MNAGGTGSKACRLLVVSAGGQIEPHQVSEEAACAGASSVGAIGTMVENLT